MSKQWTPAAALERLATFDMCVQLYNQLDEMPAKAALSDSRKALTMLATARTALEAAHHELTALHGLMAYDGAAPRESFPIQTTAVLAQIEAVLDAEPHP